MKKLAIIGAGRMACIFAQHAKKMGIETHCFAWKEGALAIEYVDFFYPISIFEKEKILYECRKIGIGGVVATTELTIAIAAFIAENLGLNGNSMKIANVITDKYRNRELTKEIEGLFHPQYKVIRSREEIECLNMNFPLILKPTSKGGKRGISVVSTKKELYEAFEYAIHDVGETEFIIEEYIDGGQEFSIESLSYHGETNVIQVTEKVSSGAPHCVELGHHQPGCISEEMKKKIVGILKKAIRKIGIENGPCHTEIKIKNSKIYLIEFNARPGGDHIAWPLTELSTGFDYIGAIINVAFDESNNIDVDKFQHNYAGVLFVTEQTKYLKPLFEICDKYEWFYKKNLVSEELTSLFHNDGYNTNYIMYYSENGRPDFANIIKELSNK